MASKKPVKAPAKGSASKSRPAATKSKPSDNIKSLKDKDTSGEPLPRQGWLQDASLEVPVPSTMSYNKPGQRELEFSVGLRQQEAEGFVRSELRARALVHANGAVLVLAEASYVNVLPENEMPESIATELYKALRPHMESLLALGGHTPPLPESLNKVD